MIMKTEFITTKEYKRFSEFCRACQKDQYIGLCYGPAGIGKTLSARYYAKWDQISDDIQSSVPVIAGTQPSVNMVKLNTIIYTPEVHNTPRRIGEDIQSLMFLFSQLKEKMIYKEETESTQKRPENHVEMLIIDEADRLQEKSLEQVRDLYDRYPMGLVLIGMPGIEKRLIRYPQLYSRVGFSHAYKALSEDEVRFILQNHCNVLGVEIKAHDFTDQESIATVIRITKGNFRLINRLLKQATRIMAVNQLSSISTEVIEAARECLVIGNS